MWPKISLNYSPNINLIKRPKIYSGDKATSESAIMHFLKNASAYLFEVFPISPRLASAMVNIPWGI